MIKNIKTYRKTLLATAVFGMMSLTACQSATTSTAQNDEVSVNHRINGVLERAAGKAAQSGQIEESLALLEKMYRRDSSNPDTAVKYARALRKTGHLNRASLVLSPFARDKDMAHTGSQIEFASIQAALGNYTIAEEFARTALEAEPEKAAAHHVLGISLDSQGSHEEAEQEFNTALETWEGDPSMVMNNLGLNLAAQGRFSEAIATLEKASSLAPYRREIERNLRIVTALAGDPDIEAVPAPSRKPQ